MPLRPLLFTLVTVTLAIIAVTLWLRAVSPLVAATPAATHPAHIAAAPQPDESLHIMVHSTLLLSFILVCLLLVVGLIATAREWLRRPMPLRPRYRTKYLDIWKLAGQRLASPEPPDASGPTKSPPFQ